MRKSCMSWLWAPASIGLIAAPAGCATTSSGVSAVPQTCPPSAPAGDGGGKAGFGRLGCANSLNLEAMVANQDDLAQGGALGPANGAREALAVEAYKEGKGKELEKIESTTSFTSGSGGAQ